MSAFTVVDLSIPFAVGMPKYDAPWFPAFAVGEVRPENMPEANWTRRFTTLSLFAHNGTHVESSDHVFRNGRTISQVPLGRFVGHPRVIRLTDIPDATEISRGDLESRLDGAIPPGAILLLHTGYDDRQWGLPDFWERSPWLSPSAAELLRDLRPALIGLDFQTEKPREREFIVHRTLLRDDAVLGEYLFNLRHVTADSLFVALPIAIEGVEAAPVRAVAINLAASGDRSACEAR
jgi:kynurenine formamidase